MDRETLKKVQAAQLEIAKEVKRVCEQLNIQYFLDSGTLLGAVRHQGFIPWDDDLDLGMLRTEYERFLKEAPSVLNDKYYIQTCFNDSQYDNIFAKVRKKGTVYREEGSPKNMKNNGVYVDIFPYDVYPDDQEKRKKQGKFLDRYRMLVFAKAGSKPWAHLTNKSDIIKVKIKCLGYKLQSLFISRDKLFKIYDEEKQRYNAELSKNLYVHASFGTYGGWVISRDCFREMTELLFEGEYFSCPKEYDKYLTMAYGDYMTPPPESERENRHNIIELKL